MVVPLTPKPTRTADVLVMVPPTIASCHEEDAALRKWPLPRYCCASCILETKTKVGSTAAKAPAPRINPNIGEVSTAPKSHTHPSHECDGRARDPEATRMRWASARPRGDGRPTDTQADTKSQSPRQGATDHCLTSRRRCCAEGGGIATVSLHELYS